MEKFLSPKYNTNLAFEKIILYNQSNLLYLDEGKYMKQTQTERLSGILLHPTSLPSPYGIGDLGKEAYAFLDFLEKSGQHLWQTLPLSPTGFGDSPYQSFSAFAGQPLLISPEHLLELGFLKTEELSDCPIGNADTVDYGMIIPWKNDILKKAWMRFENRSAIDSSLYEEYQNFVSEQYFWLEDYALFMTCKELHNGKAWHEWKDKYKKPSIAIKKQMKKVLAKNMKYYYFVQFMFAKEWKALKVYANKKGIQIIGDIPLFVSMDSADVWANQGLFQLDSAGYPTAVAGVPPDYFCADGQLWGNPLYDWKVHKRTGYKWWVARVRHQLTLCDILRIDHFRGLESYWSIPADAKTAVNGKWVPGPREDLFRAIEKELGKNLPIIAEDLGLITPEVHALRESLGFPGMKILQFAFDGDSESTYLPHHFTDTNCVCYTGTHDNNTTGGWYKNADTVSIDKVRRYMNTDGNLIHWDFIRTCLGTIAKYAIFPLQDVLGIGSDGRMNTPGVSGGDVHNWAWRYRNEALSDDLAKELKKITRLYGRCNKEDLA